MLPGVLSSPATKKQNGFQAGGDTWRRLGRRGGCFAPNLLQHVWAIHLFCLCPGHPLGTATVGALHSTCVCVCPASTSVCVCGCNFKNLWHPVTFKCTQLLCKKTNQSCVCVLVHVRAFMKLHHVDICRTVHPQGGPVISTPVRCTAPHLLPVCTCGRSGVVLSPLFPARELVPIRRGHTPKPKLFQLVRSNYCYCVRFANMHRRVQELELC